jgi:D-tyrosyl-tRNA(Tyr) deacylase
MRLVVQRVTEASVKVDGETVGAIGKGYLVLVGIGQNDTEAIVEKMADKMMRLRIFSDENDKINLSLQDVSGQLLLVSQFTLYADCRKGNRPSFVHAGAPAEAERLYQYLIAYCRRTVPVVEHGIFGADMKVSLCNDGPFTVLLDSDEIVK